MEQELNFDKEEAERTFEEQYKEAEKLLNDEDKLERFLQKLEKKLKTIPVAGNSLSYVPLMISMVRMYVKKEYTDPPIVSIVSIVAALIYVFSPIDLIPDAVPVLGYSDDAIIVSACLSLIKTDIEDYKIWRKENGMEMDDIPDYDDIAKEAEKNSKLANAFFKGKKFKNNRNHNF